MTKKIVGVTQRVDKIESYDEYREALDQRLIDWIVQSGFIPVPIPNALVNITSPNGRQSTLSNWLNTVKIDSILLSGGNDIGDIDSRDLTEKYLLLWAEENRKPVLGICRGMQMIGVYFGSKLIEVGGHVRTRHQLQVKNSQTSSLPKSVNSYHNLALDSCPDRFQVLAESEDGNIEAIKHKELSWEGWMWHPEREAQFNQIDQERFKKLMNSGK
jgi:N5-(cytidine 5'-diphosphoramidyl)-L-glutamine hydrolase